MWNGVFKTNRRTSSDEHSPTHVACMEDELTCVISYIFSARWKPGEVIAPILTCSVTPLRGTHCLSSAAYVGPGRESGASLQPRHLQRPSSRSCQLVPLWYSTYSCRARYVFPELTPRKQSWPQGHLLLRVDWDPETYPTSKRPTVNIP